VDTVRGKIRQALSKARRAVDRGTSAVEYGLMVAAIAAVVVGVTFGLGNLVKNEFAKVSSSISTCSPDPTKCPQDQPGPTQGP
jgi:pilus assembly protein Flp/PilA